MPATVGLSVLTWLVTSAIAMLAMEGVLTWMHASVNEDSDLATRKAFAGALFFLPLIAAACTLGAAVFALGDRWAVPRRAIGIVSAVLSLSTLYFLLAFAAVSSQCELGISFPPFPGSITCD